ncbi:hypothetical protein JM946_26380 [Steroidobacter sp. S1-65]|uniref:FecR protein domain-containing protein n=1 Tax=Steroidobacter gossypii TaxID=2805490 RepID=A0ABS1X4X6_9GAMM|nr:DUF6600 domain-containing protein [Steroidobacter gossypii]MBM0108273.1 hypothetical protein [Steroidobacter gossypii]
MIPGKASAPAARRPKDGNIVANSLTHWLAIVACAAAAASFNVARAQEPAEVIEPEPVIESNGAEPTAEPVVEPESSRATPVVDPPSRVARLGHVDGDVTVAPAGTDEWAEAVLNRPLTSGDRLWVERGGRAELQIGSAAVYLDGDTGFGFIELDDEVLQASLTEGAATLRVRRLAEGETIQVETPHSTVVLNKVGEYHLEVDKSGDRTIVKTRSGEAQVTGGGSQRFTVRDNERGIFSGVDSLTGHIDRLGPRTAFENWANDRDARNERSKSSRYVSRDVIGYEDLDDHGEWISEPEYGYVWRPTYVVHNWAPYRYGRWVYVSPWGWSWVDDARWGFAPFHYGRWAHIRNRWCWVPGPRHIRPVYAPALVGWVGGPSVGISVSFGNVGWYPLGPRDLYYPGYRHTPRYIRYVNVSNTYIINNNYFYGRRLPPPRFDHRHYPGGVTTVSRDFFVGGRRIGDHWVRLDENRLRNYHAERQPPAIAPYRESVLGGSIRQPPRDATRFTRGGDYFAGRVPFHRERTAIENNGGRPIGRNQLIDRSGPKRGGDFHVVRPRVSPGELNRGRPEGAVGLSGTVRGPRELNNNSVRDWQNQRNRERVEILRGVESSRPEPRRSDHLHRPPSSTVQPGGTSYYRPTPKDYARGSGSVHRNEPRESRQYSPPRQYSQPRSEPRRTYTPPPRQEPRSQPQPRVDRSTPRSSPSNNNSGSRGGSAARPWNTPKSRPD